MNFVVYLWYVAFFALIIVGMKIFGKGKWNEDVMSFDQTKAYLGFCAVAIVLHHCSHRTCASWVPVFLQRPGLGMFVNVGYLCVAAFFFCSGYGLYKSARSKPTFMNRFPVRFIPILLPYVITLGGFLALRKSRNIPIQVRNPIKMPDAEPLHPYSWYIFALLIIYLAFYLGFRFVKKDWFGILIVTIATVGYFAFCIKYQYGSWWYNSVHLFLVGVLVAKFEKGFFERLKKLYFLKLLLFLAITVVTFAIGNYAWDLMPKFNIQMTPKLGENIMTIITVAQIISALTFCMFTVMLGMKIKVGNPVLKFLGKMTLELYLVHGLFVHIFSYAVINDYGKSVCYIKNVPLYVLIVFVSSIPVAFLVHLLDSKIGSILKGSSSSKKINKT